MFHLFEYPWTTKAGTTNHDGIYSITVKTLFAAFGRRHVTITDDRNMHPWIILHFAYQCPIRLSGIHLCAGTAMYSQCGYATILQLFR